MSEPIKEIQRNADGSLDEIVIQQCTAHLEQMDDNAWWLGLTQGRDTLHLWIVVDDNGNLSIGVQEDEIGCRTVTSSS